MEEPRRASHHIQPLHELKRHLEHTDSMPTLKQRYNSHLIISDEGQIVSNYRKMHLIDIDLSHKGGRQLRESTSIVRGDKIADPVYSPCGYLGLSISFDLRFPELYRHLVLKGA